MVLDWPNTITSRHHHLRRRAEAYASAMYYSACSESGISPDGAAAAAEVARSRHSRWWLKGSDPDHPSYGSADKDLVVEDVNPKPDETTHDDVVQVQNDEDDYEVANQDENDELLNDDSNVPILARDDDMGSSFGSLSTFCTNRNSSINSVTDNGTAQRSPATLPAHSSLLPSWLTGSQTAPIVSPNAVPNQKDQVVSTEEMLNSYYNSNPNQLLTQEKKKNELPVSAVAQVTSESDADSTHSRSSLSFYPKPRFQYVESNDFAGLTRSRKRERADFSIPLDQTFLEARVQFAKAELLSRLEKEGTGPAFRKALDSLEKYSKLKASPNKKRRLSTSSVSANENADIDGTWLMISPPEYKSCLGKNAHGESLFTLGRMTFDMYQPSSLICSIQTQYNTIKSVEPKDLPICVPKSLRREVENERNGEYSGKLKTYNIIASFTIESTDDESKKLRGILTNYGYALPDPSIPDRKSIWFTGGTIEPANDDSLDEWVKIFGSTSINIGPGESSKGDTSKDSTEAEKARAIASKILLGVVHEPIDEHGLVGFHLNRPIGGHGSAFCDIVYMDDEVRIMRGHSGSIYVFKRV